MPTTPPIVSAVVAGDEADVKAILAASPVMLYVIEHEMSLVDHALFQNDPSMLYLLLCQGCKPYRPPVATVYHHFDTVPTHEQVACLQVLQSFGYFQ